MHDYAGFENLCLGLIITGLFCLLSLFLVKCFFGVTPAEEHKSVVQHCEERALNVCSKTFIEPYLDQCITAYVKRCVKLEEEAL